MDRKGEVGYTSSRQQEKQQCSFKDVDGLKATRQSLEVKKFFRHLKTSSVVLSLSASSLERQCDQLQDAPTAVSSLT